MEEKFSKVCRRCGTLNDVRGLMCVRCGEELDEVGKKKYEILKDRLVSGPTVFILFASIFSGYLYGMFFYVMPWISEKLLLFGQTFIFDYYNNQTITYIALESIYTLVLATINYVIVVLLLETIVGSKILKETGVRRTILFINLFLLIIAGVLTYLKNGLDYVIMIEHLVSVIVTMSYVKKKLLKRSV